MPRYRSIPTIADIDRQLRRRRLVKRGSAWGILLLVVSIVLDHFGVFGHKGNDWRNLDQQQVVVTKVVDGDTVHVKATVSGAEEKVRLIGIDAPELHFNHKSPPDYWAEQATKYLTDRSLGKTITLKIEPTQTRDRYGRLLGYLYVTDTDNLNADMVRDGQAYADRRFKHTFRPQFEQAEAEARKKQRGLWKNVQKNQMPPWRQKWLDTTNRSSP